MRIGILVKEANCFFLNTYTVNYFSMDALRNAYDMSFGGMCRLDT